MAAVIISELSGIIYFLSADKLISIFDSSYDVVNLGVKQARIESLFYCILAFSHAVASVCRGAGKPIVPMAVMLSVWCVFRVTYILTMMHFFHSIELVYWAYPITWGISSVIYFIYYKCSNWVYGFEERKII